MGFVLDMRFYCKSSGKNSHSVFLYTNPFNDFCTDSDLKIRCDFISHISRRISRDDIWAIENIQHGIAFSDL